jgi:hypothetical protein
MGITSQRIQTTLTVHYVNSQRRLGGDQAIVGIAGGVEIAASQSDGSGDGIAFALLLPRPGTSRVTSAAPLQYARRCTVHKHRNEFANRFERRLELLIINDADPIILAPKERKPVNGRIIKDLWFA